MTNGRLVALSLSRLLLLFLQIYVLQFCTRFTSHMVNVNANCVLAKVCLRLNLDREKEAWTFCIRLFIWLYIEDSAIARHLRIDLLF